MAEIASNFYTCPHFSPARFAPTHLSPSSSQSHATTPNIYSPLTHIMLDMQLRACRTRSQDHTSTGATSKTRCTTLSHTDVAQAGLPCPAAGHRQASTAYKMYPKSFARLRRTNFYTFTCLQPVLHQMHFYAFTGQSAKAKAQTFTIYATPIAIVAYLHTSSCCWRGPTPKGESYA